MNEVNAKIIIDPAFQYYIQVDGHSWATFTFSDKGDFNIVSDWGYWYSNWRSYGDDFRKFLKDLTLDYLFGCLERNAMQFYGLKNKMSKRQKEAITVLFKKFQQQL